MNFLTHLYFTNKSEDNIKGILIGKSFQPISLANSNAAILKGIAIDIQIAHFSETNPAFQRSIKRLNQKYTRYATFIVNVFYDHFLAKNWENFSNESLEGFSKRIFNVMLNNRNLLPNPAKKLSAELISYKLLTSLISIEGTHQYIKFISRKDRISIIVDNSLSELLINYREYNNDFEEYFTDLCKAMIKETERFNTINDKNKIFLLTALSNTFS